MMHPMTKANEKIENIKTGIYMRLGKKMTPIAFKTAHLDKELKVEIEQKVNDRYYKAVVTVENTSGVIAQAGFECYSFWNSIHGVREFKHERSWCWSSDDEQ